jgi:hypothetical protein
MRHWTEDNCIEVDKPDPGQDRQLLVRYDPYGFNLYHLAFTSTAYYDIVMLLDGVIAEMLV